MPITEFQKQVKKYFKELEQRIQRDNQQLHVLRQLIFDDPQIAYYPGTAKVQEMIVECMRNNGGYADLAMIRDCLHARGVSVDRPKLSVILTKCSAIAYSRSKSRWELIKKNGIDTTKEESLLNTHH